MIDPVRQDVVTEAHTLVVKVGTNVLAGSDGTHDQGRIQALADGLRRIRESGRKVALVSSGAIGAGVGRHGLGKRPSDRYFRDVTTLGETIAEGGFKSISGLVVDEILMPYKSE